jgi:UbiD family decarboxylase
MGGLQAAHAGGLVIGWDPIIPFLAGSPVAAGICEWDVMGAYRGNPVELVRCETVDLEVPASAEIVIEGYISDDPATFESALVRSGQLR